MPLGALAKHTCICKISTGRCLNSSRSLTSYLSGVSFKVQGSSRGAMTHRLTDMSPSSASYRDAFKIGTDVDEDSEHPPLPPPDPGVSGELPINPALVAAFLESLSDKNMHIHFLCGPWSTYNIDRRFDVILTSETMYRPESIPDLLDVLWRAYVNPPSLAINATLEGAMQEKLSLDDPRCYVAGKVLYFGVGGGLPDFVSGLENPRGSRCSRRGGKCEVLKEHSQGVVRKILRVSWD